ncbi:MAG: dTDP-4-dehydrorhamnose 3,5-epimerase family protein [Methanobacteriota archaeon]|nr:MAG: dTDP-4-dehydrorhamnose 3,5-epimerase family protein [Euryarchaeota archaeon]
MDLIDGVSVRELRQIHDERGYLMELMRSDWEEFENFGQVYMTSAYPGVVKAWHYHKAQTDNFICVFGMAKVVLYDPREDSPTKGKINEFFVGEKKPLLIRIPPLVYHGFKAVGHEKAVIVNVPTKLYDYENPDEHRVPYDSKDVDYDWDVKMG